MSDIGRYTKLTGIVAFYLSQYKKSSGDRDEIWLLAFRCFQMMGFNTNWEPLTIKLELNQNRTANLPPDYISWSKIGCMNASWEVETLKVNRTLSKFKDTNPNRQQYLHPDAPEGDWNDIALNPYFLNYYFGNWYTPLFGVGNGIVTYGDVNVDEDNKIIIFGKHYPFTDCTLEYISAPERNPDYQIETCMVEAVIAFIAWQEKLNTEQNFYNWYKVGRGSLPGKKRTLQDINQAIRENHGYKIKN